MVVECQVEENNLDSGMGVLLQNETFPAVFMALLVPHVLYEGRIADGRRCCVHHSNVAHTPLVEHDQRDL